MRSRWMAGLGVIVLLLATSAWFFVASRANPPSPSDADPLEHPALGCWTLQVPDGDAAGSDLMWFRLTIQRYDPDDPSSWFIAEADSTRQRRGPPQPGWLPYPSSGDIFLMWRSGQDGISGRLEHRENELRGQFLLSPHLGPDDKVDYGVRTWARVACDDPVSG
jgi:hypothetical protein